MRLMHKHTNKIHAMKITQLCYKNQHGWMSET